MKWLLLALLSGPVLTGLAAQSTAASPAYAVLNLRVENIRAGHGRIWVGVYTSAEDFLDRERARVLPYEITRPGDTTLRVDSLVVGETYALAIFQDLDDNHDLNTNWLGLPAEPWAVSRPIQSYFRAPRFAEMSFVFRGGETRRMRLR